MYFPNTDVKLKYLEWIHIFYLHQKVCSNIPGWPPLFRAPRRGPPASQSASSADRSHSWPAAPSAAAAERESFAQAEWPVAAVELALEPGLAAAVAVATAGVAA